MTRPPTLYINPGRMTNVPASLPGIRLIGIGESALWKPGETVDLRPATPGRGERDATPGQKPRALNFAGFRRRIAAAVASRPAGSELMLNVEMGPNAFRVPMSDSQACQRLAALGFIADVRAIAADYAGSDPLVYQVYNSQTDKLTRSILEWDQHVWDAIGRPSWWLWKLTPPRDTSGAWSPPSIAWNQWAAEHAQPRLERADAMRRNTTARIAVFVAPYEPSSGMVPLDTWRAFAAVLAELHAHTRLDAVVVSAAGFEHDRPDYGEKFAPYVDAVASAFPIPEQGDQP